MSLYNMLFGTNPFSSLLLKILGADPNKIPRFRDCYLNEEGEIVIHTRTGGGNRDAYEKGGSDQAEYNKDGPFNDDLRAIEGYIDDADDDFDSTYADFRYKVPEPAKPIVDMLKTMGGVQNPGQRWQDLLASMKKGNLSDPATARAVAVGEQIVAGIEKALEQQGQDGGAKES